MQFSAVRSSALRIAALGAAIGATAFIAPSPASAAGCQGAPGTSALEQYCEAIPDATGGRQNPNSAGSGSSGSGSGPSNSGSGVSSKTSQALKSAGADGAAVEQLAGGAAKSSGSSSGSEKSSKTSSSNSSSGGSSGSANASVAVIAGTTPVAAPEDPSNSPLKATTKAVAGGPTVGSGLVWGLLGMSAIGAVAAVVLRRNRTPLDPPSTD